MNPLQGKHSMAIINCPSCNQRTSDKAKVCSNCHYDFFKKSTSEGLTEEQLASKKHLSHIKKKYSLQIQAMTGIILVLLGVSLWYFGGRGFSSVSDILKLLLLATGATWYLVTRVRLILFKKEKTRL